MMRPLTAALALSLATLLSVSKDAQAQRVPCGDGAGLISHLEKEWGEDPAVIALDAAGRMVRVLANPETGTWSLLITGPGGPTCLVQSGTAWEPIPPPVEPGDPS